MTHPETRLRARLREVQSKITALEKERRHLASPSFGEQAREREADETNDGLEEQLIAEATQIERALAALGDGTYGICLSCEDAIDPDRLEVLPDATLCRSCAVESERLDDDKGA